MNTSNYRKSGTHPDAVSIAGAAPDWYTGRQYKKLAPRWACYSKYVIDKDEYSYTETYTREVLDRLDPHEVLNALGESAVLLCYEEDDEFCHRKLVAKWLTEHTGIIIKEV